MDTRYTVDGKIFTQFKMDQVLDRVSAGKMFDYTMVLSLGLSENGRDNLSKFLEKRGYVFSKGSLTIKKVVDKIPTSG